MAGNQQFVDLEKINLSQERRVWMRLPGCLNFPGCRIFSEVADKLAIGEYRFRIDVSSLEA